MHVAHSFTVFSMAVFMFIQCTDLCANSIIFSIPMSLLCNCCRICFCNRKRIIILLPFMAMPPIIASLLLISQQYWILCSSSSFCVASHLLCMVLPLQVGISCVATCMSFMDVHTGIFTVVLVAFTLSSCQWFFLSLSSVWFFLDSQFVMYRSGPELYIMQTPSWCMQSIICCNCWDNMATSLLRIATNDLWSVMTHNSLTKQ